MKPYNPPTCPFCGRVIAKPTYLPIGFSDLEAGICECGSVYVCDVPDLIEELLLLKHSLLPVLGIGI